jgi:hypothetical protein
MSVDIIAYCVAYSQGGKNKKNLTVIGDREGGLFATSERL